ncbi:MAG: peptide deformylase [Candidatus Desulfofervidus auxilii]|nr:peptide deformylase [Candidatus Desulfofervidus auxilii]
MAILPIVKYPEPILKKPAAQIEKVTKEIRHLLDDMAETMYSACGVGLAAPQIGKSLRLIVLDPTGNEGKQLITLVNPIIVAGEGEIEGDEGCLSLPGVICNVKRFAKVRVRGIDPVKGKTIEIEAEGFLARIFQHEIDHLEGKLIWDRLGMLKREFYKRRYLKQFKK